MIARAWQRFRRDGAAMFGLALVAALALVALVGPWLVGDPNVSDFSLERGISGAPPPPSAEHLLGTDPLYRDLLARLVHGARLSLGVAVAATALALAIGAALGVAAGMVRGRARALDAVIMRVVDVALALPYLLLVTFIGVAVDRAEPITVVLVLGLTGWAGIARLVRARTLAVAREDYLLAARALGAKTGRLVAAHVLPAIAPTLLIIGSHAAGQMILAEAVLGYLAVGIEPPHPTWGRMLHEAESYLTVAPWLLAAPGLAILLAVLGFTRVGDGLRDALDPRATAPPHRFRFAIDLSIVAIVIVVAAFSRPEGLAAPRHTEAPLAEPRPGGTLRVASMVEIHGLDPAIAYDELSTSLAHLAFATLVSWNREAELVGDLAERFEIEDAGRRVRFVLRPQLRFHDGSALTSADVKRSLERMLHPKTPSPGAAHYGAIRGLEAFAADPGRGIDGIRVIDDRRFVIELSAPDAGFVSRLGMPFAAPVCRSMTSPADPKATSIPCGAGPFQIEELRGGEVVRLKRFDGYYAPAHLDRIEWQLGVAASTQRYRFERGDLDLLLEMSGPDAYRFAHDPRWAPYRAWEAKSATTFIFLNTSRAPFDNRHLRRAVALAVDPGVLSLVRADAVETTRVLPPGFPGPKRVPLRRHDREAALEEMSLAGYPFDPVSDSGGYPHLVDYLTVPDSFEQAAAEIFQQQLARVGIRLRLRLVEFATFLALMSQPRQTMMGYRGWSADYPDPASFFEPLLTSQALRQESTQNVSFFSHPRLDAILAEARRETEWPARMELFDEAERIVADEAPLIPVYAMRVLHVHQPWVQGYRPHPVLGADLRAVWLTGGAR